MSNKKNKIKKATKKLSIFLVLIRLVFSTCNILSLADDNPKSPINIHHVISPASAIERNEIKINVFIQNVGEVNITDGEFKVFLYVDNENDPVAFNYTTENLDINEIKEINITWITQLGESEDRTLHIIVEYEGDCDNCDKIIKIIERITDFTFYGNIILKGQLRINQTITINTIVQNIGKNTTEKLNASLFINGEFIQSNHIDGLIKDEKYNISFDWKPNVSGEFHANISLDKNDEIDEQDETNNFDEIIIYIDETRFDWWNPNWHYRKSFRVDGTGNVSIKLNFTKLLENLSVTEENFENDSIVIVKYQATGEVIGIVEEFFFEESINFDPINNATGTLSWFSKGDSYYCVFFDVSCNNGTRNESVENSGLNLSNQEVTIKYIGCEEGWWSEWSENMPPLSNYYLPFSSQGQEGDEMFLNVNTKANASEVKARFVLNDKDEEFLNLNSSDGLYWEGIAHFTDIGNWNMTIISTDNAGYQNTELTHDFYVGYPDLFINSLNISSESSQYGTFYEGTDITIKTNVSSHNTTVFNVNVSLLIDDDLATYEYLDIEKNIGNNVEFVWSFRAKGTYNVKIYVDHENNISESNEDNNSMNQNIIIEGRPDIGIINMTIPSDPVSEGNSVNISARLHNYGIGNATHYRINLYLEQNDENNDGILDESMYYRNEKNHSFIDLKINETKTINLIWDPIEYGKFEGEWIVGIKVISNSSHPDSDVKNNAKSSLPRHLIVISTIPREEIKPKIQLIKPKSSESFEQGKSVEIISKITDESGIKKVELEITKPNNNIFSVLMTNEEDDEYSYIFEDTDILGRYSFNITAFDNSFYENIATLKSSFIIIGDATPPEIKNTRALPSTQLINEEVKITSTITDYSEVKLVQVTIIYPDSSSETQSMAKSVDKNYIYKNSFEALGKYSFYITAEDEFGNKINTMNALDVFWITKDLEDTDSDGMPDWWEEKYDFDPFDPADASEDEDDDGFTNVEEYEAGTDPLNPVTFMERLEIKLKENWMYLLSSLFLFIILISISFYGWRKEIT